MKEMEWISVKDRFPENERTVLIAVRRKWYNCPSEYYNFVAKAFHTDGKHHTEESDYIWDFGNFENFTYDEENDADVIPEGWWESVDYSEEFGAIDDEVTHWMELSELPKEK